MKKLQIITFMILLISANFLFARDPIITLTPVNNFPVIYSNVDNDAESKMLGQSCGMHFSQDGKHSVGVYFIPENACIPERSALYIDGLHSMVLPCDRSVSYIQVYSEFGLDKCLFKYSFRSCIPDKRYEVLCLAGNGELFTIEHNQDSRIDDAWFDKIEGVPYIMAIVSNNKGRYQSLGVDPDSLISMISLGENQNYIYKTFSSPNSKVSFRLETEDELQTFVYVDSQGNEKAITGPCKAIYGIHAYKDSCYFATISEQGKTYYNYWNNGNLKILDFETFVHPEDVKIVEETDGKTRYTIKTKDKQYGPFLLANSLVLSGDYSHWSAVVKRTADSKFCFIIDGKFSQEFDDIMKINDYVISDSWHTYTRRGNQWYRVEIKWNDTSSEE